MITLIITLFVIIVIQFSIYLILEFTIYKQSKKQQNEYDKLSDFNRSNIHFDSDICESGNNATNENEKA